MKKISKLIFATDFSETSKHAEEIALQLREQLGAQLHLTHIFDPVSFEMPAPYYFMPGADQWLKERMENLRNQGREALEKYAEQIGGCTVHFLEGKPGAQLVGLAEEQEADLIIMGTHGHKGLNRMLLGSVTEYVMRHCGVPVLTIRP